MSNSYKRIILVTGANTGIGFETVKSLAEKGHRVYLAARNIDAGKEAQSTLAASGLDVHFVQLDVTSPESIAAAKDVVLKAEGRLDSLVNNAGVGLMHKSTGALTESRENIQNALDVNFFGTIAVSQAFAPLLLLAPPGQACIVNVTSRTGSNTFMAGKEGHLHDWIAYNARKSALNSYSIALARALEGKVRVNVVSPGFVTSKLNGFTPGGKTWREGAEFVVPWALLGPEDKDKNCLFWSDVGELPW
ncbi:NAD(P)-binding protein [Hymenopellis radicata]|nr:NAD(P)-binding protein [Hymenopellis radicata]